MSVHPHPLTRDGLEPNRAGRAGVAAAMTRLLDDGRRFCDPEADIEAEQVRSWAERLRELSLDLADCIEAPVRNRVMQVLSLPSLPDDTCALYALRLNVLGMSTRELGLECDVAGGTIDRIEDGAGCQPRVAKSIADRFALSVLELFGHENDSLTVRTVGQLREAMLTPPEFPVARR